MVLFKFLFSHRQRQAQNSISANVHYFLYYVAAQTFCPQSSLLLIKLRWKSLSPHCGALQNLWVATAAKDFSRANKRKKADKLQNVNKDSHRISSVQQLPQCLTQSYDLVYSGFSAVCLAEAKAVQYFIVNSKISTWQCDATHPCLVKSLAWSESWSVRFFHTRRGPTLPIHIYTKWCAFSLE